MKKNPIKQLGQWFTGLFKKTDEKLYRNLDSSIGYANQFKRFVNSTLLKGGIAITPTKYDDIALEVLIKLTDEVISSLGIAKQCSTLPSHEERLKCLVMKLKETHSSELNGLYLKIAAWYFKRLEDRRGEYKGLSTAENLVNERYIELKNEGLV
jgi:hypothetical protein